MKTLLISLTAMILVACAKQETVAPAPAPSSVAAAPATEATPLPGDDPEPAGAQARAEAVAGADFNRDKRTSLQMNITTLIDHTSGIVGMASQLAAREEKIEDKLSRLGARVTETEVTIQLPGAVLFDFDSSRIRADAERALRDVVQVIGSYTERPVRVEGHTDSMASDDYNLKLSEARAKSVVEWLAANGAERPRLHASGIGETKPVATNDTSEGRQKNRRVEIVIARK